MSHKFSFFKKDFTTIFLLLPLILVNPAFAQSTEIQMDWLIEGQLEKEIVTTQEAEIVSNYEELVEKEVKPVYDKFITGNKYSMGDYKITIDSEEGQVLAGMLIEQRDLRQDSFKHKIKYYDRFSDGYVQIAEALLDPIGDSKYLIKGQAFDYNPNSNLELFVLERGYTMDNLEAIPNDIFTPKEFTLGRQLMGEATRSGEGEFDLREYSPNYLLLNKEQIQERMNEAFSEQTSQLFDGILSGEQLPPGKLPELGIGVSSPTSESESIFDNFKFEKPKFENTRHVRDSLQSNPFQITDPAQSLENISLLLMIPVFVALAVFGYLLRKKLSQRKPQEPVLLVSKPQTDFRELTQQMIHKSQSLFDNNQRKEAFEALSQAIRYYYSQNMEIYKEMTNHELLSVLNKSKSDAYGKVRGWLLLCGSVEYAKYDSSDADFKDALSKFTKEVSK
ncbi:MAG: hypothetical protein EA443_01645 [Nitrosopumilus sp.]|nr:MAG: hypothetical protein EA443_01645 [Nitrosopumilus sp.]